MFGIWKNTPKGKTKLHPRNKHRDRYDFGALVKSCPALKKYIQKNKNGEDTIDFFDPNAVKLLNTALLKEFYGIEYWEIPHGSLCPPIPGRADYLHYAADLLGEANKGKPPTGKKVTVLDVGIGSNCIYPILGVQEYGWSFIGSDVDKTALGSAKRILKKNDKLKGRIEVRSQDNPNHQFKGIIGKEELIDLTVCNPPFHSSEKDAEAAARKKLKGLTGKKVDKAVLNFGGKSNELWCEGGEKSFIKGMIKESRHFAGQVLWFSTLVSKKSSLKKALKTLKKVEAADHRIIEMTTGNKHTRLLAWTFHKPKMIKEWAKARW